MEKEIQVKKQKKKKKKINDYINKQKEEYF